MPKWFSRLKAQVQMRRREGEAALPETVLYTRAGCCLCDEARDILSRHGLIPKEIDIDANEELRGKYTDCVPVVIIAGKERFRGRINEVLLRRLLAAERAAPNE